MPSDFAYSSLRRLASAPGARHVIQRMRGEQDEIRLAIGRLESHLLDVRKPSRLEDAEFKVFSQFGEDGIIQHLVRSVAPAETTFVEIGTGDYRESNTRFLLQNNNWRGVVIDGGEAHVQFVTGTEMAWRYDVEPVSAFVTKENVNALISDNGLRGPIGLLSVDVDGIDYWLWDAIDVVEPAIVVSEYNALWGPDATITVPYDPSFVNVEAHYSMLYFGASLGALVHLAGKKGYRFVGCASNGANAFFVREDLAGDLPAHTARSGFREAHFLTGRNPDRTLSRERSIAKRLALIGQQPVIDVTTGQETTVAAAVGARGVE
ncbi:MULTISPECIES: hypothetical protein [unclassified Nocardioides]|uniref:hypothetical protein n=1 Tax=unclassified Nocardioides TaxID=2615069 RepID=UPI000702FB37|nr:MULTISPECIES: hypothetical protein [unclassified Nocardioides]KRC53898.1 hypothetical protein ASE19_07390 [Nocardioides sp. Root79]KRC71234.1 hypothetical protein ASE20_09805 [Nocardioides sp. Root240]